jgi:hypothetical protein
MKTWVIVLVWCCSCAIAATVPLVRYFPDHALGSIELNDIQGAIDATGQFGEETIRTLTGLLNESLDPDTKKSLGNILGTNLGIRVVLGALRDFNLAVYSNPKTREPQVLLAARINPAGVLGRLAGEAYRPMLNDRSVPKLREGAYVALKEDDFWFGYQNGLIFGSSNPDLLRSYLRRIQGQNLPVLTAGAAYKSAMGSVGPGWFRYYLNLSHIAKAYGSFLELPQEVLASMRTLNMVASSWAVTARGSEGRTAWLLDQGGGDAALYRLMTHTPPRLELPALANEGATAVASYAIDSAGWLDYIQGWNNLFEQDADERAAAAEAIAKLKQHLGNEYGLMTSGDFATNLLSTSAFTRLITLSDNPETLGLKPLLQLYGGLQVMAQVQDGTAAMEAIVKGLESEASARVERIQIGGYEALKITDTSDDISVYLLNKDRFLVAGLSQEGLEAMLAGPSITASADFTGYAFPSPLVGQQFARPYRLSREQLDKMLDSYMGMLDSEGINEAVVPAKVKEIVLGWLENWQHRLSNNHGYALVKGSRLIFHTVNGFRWN